MPDKKQNKNNTGWAWILSLGMLSSAALMCLCGRSCSTSDCVDCNKKTEYVKEPAIRVDGDAIIIHGDNNDATIIKGNNNNVANRSSGNQNSEKAAPKPVTPKPVTPKPVEPKPVEPKPQEQECKTVTKTTYRKITIEGDADEAAWVANQIMNGRCH